MCKCGCCYVDPLSELWEPDSWLALRVLLATTAVSVSPRLLCHCCYGRCLHGRCVCRANGSLLPASTIRQERASAAAGCREGWSAPALFGAVQQEDAPDGPRAGCDRHDLEAARTWAANKSIARSNGLSISRGCSVRVAAARGAQRPCTYSCKCMIYAVARSADATDAATLAKQNRTASPKAIEELLVASLQ